MLPDSVRNRLRASPAADVWGIFRRGQLHREYDRRREHYRRIALERGLQYDESASIAAIRTHLLDRGVRVAKRELGKIHTFTFVPKVGWHGALLPDLRELGPVTEFDCESFGIRWSDMYRRDAGFVERRRKINALFRDELIRVHRENPVDFVFIYASGWEILADTLRLISKEIKVPLVNMCLDDKQSWTGPIMDGQHFGQVDVAAAFDLSWTSASVACEWYMAEGARPLYMPEGFDGRQYKPLSLSKDIPVSFIGAAYGFRPSIVRFLKRRAIPIQAFGPGWGSVEAWGDDQIRIINRSVINLGLGGIGYSEDLTNVKTRDFEIPGAGGGLYLTSFNPDLARHYDVGREIVCYRNRDEMLELIRYYLARPLEAAFIAERARKRCLREHRWLHRYIKVCRALGILEGDPISPA